MSVDKPYRCYFVQGLIILENWVLMHLCNVNKGNYHRTAANCHRLTVTHRRKKFIKINVYRQFQIIIILS